MGYRADKKTKNGSEDDNSLNVQKTKIYPHGGWKWMILFSAFIFNVMVDGCSYSFGVLLTNLVNDFEASRSDVAWIGSVFASTPLLCGPIASFATKRYGFRKASIFGGVIAFLGIFTSRFAPSVEILCITYGVIGGFGFSLPYLVSSVIVPIYFHRRVALASGVAECGSGVGTLIFAPLLEYLISEYGWRGAILITAAIVANIVVCGGVNRPFSQEIRSSREGKDTKNIETNLQKPTNEMFCKKVPETMGSANVFMSDSSSDGNHNVAQFSIISNVGNSESTNETPNELTTSCSKFELMLPCHKCRIIERNEEEETCCTSKCPIPFFDTSILFNWRYIMFSLSNIILYLWYDVPYMFSVDRAVELGEREFDASLLISAVGVLHTIGNVVFGFIGDRKCVNRSLFYSVALWICGLSLAVVPLFDQLIHYGIFLGVYGLLSAVTGALKVAILVDIVGMAKLTDAYGLLLFLQGIANLTGPPIAGRLFDVSGSYDHTFYTAGISLVAAGIFSVIPSFGQQNNMKE